MSENNQNGLAITCVDARLHRYSITPQVAALLGVDNVYVRTLVGPESRILGGEQSVHLQSLRLSMTDLVPLKNIKKVAVIGHCDCAGHPVSDQQHEKDCVSVITVLREFFPELEFVPMIASEAETERPWNVRIIGS